MKKITSLILAVAMALSAAFVLSGCQTTSSASKVTYTLYANSPDNEYAILAMAGYKATSGYTGTTKLTVRGTPDTSSIQPILTYYGYCEGIRAAIESGTGRSCTLTFNTKRDGSGKKLKFSNASEALTSLLTMIAYDYTSVYAIYRF